MPYVPNSSFIVYVATPKGIADYLERIISKGIIQPISFFRPLIVVKEYDERKVFSFIRSHIENIRGRDEKELILRAMEYFDVNEETYRVDDIYNHLLYTK